MMLKGGRVCWCVEIELLVVLKVACWRPIKGWCVQIFDIRLFCQPSVLGLSRYVDLFLGVCFTVMGFLNCRIVLGVGVTCFKLIKFHDNFRMHINC